jgi:transcriptional regulator with XRE-family HTH domain
MTDVTGSTWIKVLRQFRNHQGITQTAFASMLGVNQTTVSRWESGHDLPSPAAQHRIRDLMRRKTADRHDGVVRVRVRHSVWPASIVCKGAVFLECNQGVACEIGRAGTDMRGSSVYGNFGPQTDEVTKQWEMSGIFKGDVALTITINALDLGTGQPVFLRTMDSPHMACDGDIWSICEAQRIDEPTYHRLRTEFGGTTLVVPFDAMS